MSKAVQLGRLKLLENVTLNISNYSRPKKGTSPKVSSFTEVKQNINTLPSFQDIVEELVRYNLDLFAEKDTELGKTQTVKMKIDTGDHKHITFINNNYSIT